MKRAGTIVGLVLVILIAGNGCNNDRHARKDHADMMRMGQNFRRHPMWGMHGNMDSGMRFGMMRGMHPGMKFGMMRGMHPGTGFGMRKGMSDRDSIGWMPMGPGRRMLESIPNVTENQKKQIEDLVKKQHDEIMKLREEMHSKMQSIIDSHRKDMLNILTDEQKKFIESEKEKTSPTPEKVK